MADVASILKGIVKRDALRKQEINHADHNAQSGRAHPASVLTTASRRATIRVILFAAATYLHVVLFAQKPMYPFAASNQDGIIAQYRKETGDATENKLILQTVLY